MRMTVNFLAVFGMAFLFLGAQEPTPVLPVGGRGRVPLWTGWRGWVPRKGRKRTTK